MLKNMKFAILSFMITALLIVITGLVSLSLIQRADVMYDYALIGYGVPQSEISSLNTDLYQDSSLVLEIIFLTDETELAAAQKDLEETQTKITAAFDELKYSCSSATELDLIRTIENTLFQYEEKRNQVIKLGLENRKQEALMMFRQEARPLLTECLQTTDKLTELKTTLGNQMSDDFAAQSDTSRMIIVVLMIITLVTAVLFVLLGVFFSRSHQR